MGSSYPLWNLEAILKSTPNSFKTVLEVKEQYSQMESWNKYTTMQTYKVHSKESSLKVTNAANVIAWIKQSGNFLIVFFADFETVWRSF